MTSRPGHLLDSTANWHAMTTDGRSVSTSARPHGHQPLVNGADNVREVTFDGHRAFVQTHLPATLWLRGPTSSKHTLNNPARHATPREKASRSFKILITQQSDFDPITITSATALLSIGKVNAFWNLQRAPASSALNLCEISILISASPADEKTHQHQNSTYNG